MKIGKKKKQDAPNEAKDKGTLYKIFQNAYAPFILSKPARAAVVVVFVGWLCTSIAVAPRIEVGLDQDLSMPEDSYMMNYLSVSLAQLLLPLLLIYDNFFLNIVSDPSISKNICPLVLQCTSSCGKAIWTTRTRPRCKSFAADWAATSTL